MVYTSLLVHDRCLPVCIPAEESAAHCKMLGIIRKMSRFTGCIQLSSNQKHSCIQSSFLRQPSPNFQMSILLYVSISVLGDTECFIVFYINSKTAYLLSNISKVGFMYRSGPTIWSMVSKQNKIRQYNRSGIIFTVFEVLPTILVQRQILQFKVMYQASDRHQDKKNIYILL